MTRRQELPVAGQAGAALRDVKTGSSRRCDHVFPGRADQVVAVRALLREVLAGCPVSDEAVLLGSELVANAVLHSRSGRSGGQFTMRATVHEGECVRAEIEDQGGPWDFTPIQRGRWHGLDLVNELASDWGRCGAQDSGWVVWFRVDWPARPVDGGACE